MIKDLKKPSNTEKLCLDVAKRVGKHNIPALFIAVDKDKDHSCVVMDSRKEMREVNIMLLLDAMLNGEESKELINVVLGASAMLIAELQPLEERFMEIFTKMKAEFEARKNETQVTDNIAEA